MATAPVQKPLVHTIADIIPAVRALSRSEKFHIAQILLDDLAKEELPAAFKEGHVFPIYTPEYASNAAAQLAQALMEERRRFPFSARAASLRSGKQAL